MRDHEVARVAVITGAGGGIGAAIAARLATEGYALALVDRDEGALGRLGATLSTSTASTHVVDLAAPGALDTLAADVVARHGRVDVLVNNAGLTVHGLFADQARDDVDLLLDVNLRAPLHACRAFLPHLLASRGHIVNVSSMAALHGIPFQSTYAASKAALRLFSASLRIELRPRGVGVTAVLPGTIATPFLRRARSHHPRASERMAALMLRFGTSPERVAARVARAIRWNRREVRVGWDAHLIAGLVALAPWAIRAALGLSFARLWRRVSA